MKRFPNDETEKPTADHNQNDDEDEDLMIDTTKQENDQNHKSSKVDYEIKPVKLDEETS